MEKYYILTLLFHANQRRVKCGKRGGICQILKLIIIFINLFLKSYFYYLFFHYNFHLLLLLFFFYKVISNIIYNINIEVIHLNILIKINPFKIMRYKYDRINYNKYLNTLPGVTTHPCTIPCNNNYATNYMKRSEM